jgi:hypothetical protein
MQQLLESEGIEVVENQIVDFENILGTACKWAVISFNIVFLGKQNN